MGEIDDRTLFDQSPNPMWVYDPETLAFLKVNEAAIRHYGYTRDEFLARKLTDIRPESEVTAFLEAMREPTSKPRTGLWKHRRKDGSIIDVVVSSTPIDNGQAARLVAVTDITTLQRAHEEMHFLAHHDPLTHLPNRALLADRLDQAIKQAQRHMRITAVAFIDLDGFKPVNDTYGHAAGDELLIGVGERLTELVRSGDTVARAGGDEFIILLADLARVDDAATMGRKILEAFAIPFSAGGAKHRIGASVGIAITPYDGNDAGTLLRCADAAMYVAKERGGSDVHFFSSGIHSAATKRVTLENALRSAVANQEYHLVYQPIVNVAKASVVGMEALLRWNHPTLGTLRPLDFFATLEETDFLMPLAEWTLDRACADRATWQRAVGDYPLRVGWNVSARELHNRTFSSMVTTIIERHALDPALLEVDVNERILAHGTDEVFLSMEFLHARGIGLAIDDFGASFSAMEFLKNVPLSTLKLDRGLVANVMHDPFEHAMARAIVDVSHTLGIRVLAEGVETAEEWAFVRDLACDEAQGLYLGEALPAEAVPAFLRGPFTLAGEAALDFDFT